MIVPIAINRSLCMFVCLFGWWGVLVFGWELLLSEFLFNHLDRTACVLPVKHEYTRQFMAGKTLSQLPNNILPYFVIFFLYRVSQKFVPLISCTITFDQNYAFT